jgi:2-methylcitrate dehydratase PrpD
MRSRVEVMLTNGQKLVREADERYRGGPDNPLSDAELIEKFTDCTQSILSQATRELVIEAVFGMEDLVDVKRLIDLAATTYAG